jgi:hypothetical protein
MGGSAYGRETVGWSLAIPTTAARGLQPSKPLWTNIDRIPGGRQSPGAADRGEDCARQTPTPYQLV